MNSIEAFRRNNQSIQSRQAGLESVAAGMTVSTCRIKINNTGETPVEFLFACSYSQLPSITFGFEIQSRPRYGNIPLISGKVDEWIATDILPNSRLYTGANLIISSEAVDGVSFIATATATGIAFSGPLK